MRSPFRMAFPGGVRGSASGVYSESSGTYPSSIDTTSGLYVKWSRDTGFTHTIPLLMTHGFSGSASDFTVQDLRDLSSLGFCAFAPGMRGRDGGGGSADGSGREIFDLLDALDFVRRTVPTVDQQIAFAGPLISGGAGNGYNLVCKAPDVFTGWACCFGISDYGYDATNGWYNQPEGASAQSAIAAMIGAHSDLTTYRARNSLEAIATNLALDPLAKQRLWIYADNADSTVAYTQSKLVADALAAAGIPRIFGLNNRASQAGDAIRYSHGYPNQSPGVRSSYVDWAASAKALKAWTVKPAGVARVLGWMKTRRFEIWTGETSSPTPRASGGTKRVLDLTYDVNAGTYLVTPLNGTCYVQVIQGARSALQQVSSATTLTVS